MWQEGYSDSENFLKALEANFFDKIAKITAVIFDKKGSCRGYISPYMFSRDGSRELWDRAGFILTKNVNGIKVFGRWYLQPKPYQKLFQNILENSLKTGMFSTDFCPCNVALDSNGELFLIDLDSVSCIQDFMQKPRSHILITYCPIDYLEALQISQK